MVVETSMVRVVYAVNLLAADTVYSVIVMLTASIVTVEETQTIEEVMVTVTVEGDGVSVYSGKEEKSALCDDTVAVPAPVPVMARRQLSSISLLFSGPGRAFVRTALHTGTVIANTEVPVRV
jgi:hypothetical protein